MIVTRPISTNYGSLERNILIQQGPGALKLGQIIDAVALSNSSQGHVNLRIGNSVLAASTNITMQQNTHLLLEVMQIHPRLLLRLIPSSVDSAAAKPLKDAMISFLPRQAGLAPSLAGLIHRTLMEDQSLQQHSLRTLVNKLVNALPVRNSIINAEGVRQTILHSGLFLESLMARHAGKARLDTSRDIKACLLRLQYGLAQFKQRTDKGDSQNNTLASHLYSSIVPPRKKGLPVPQQRVPFSHISGAGDTDNIIQDLVTRTQGAIARLGLLQVISSENFNNGEYMWQLEIPVKHTGALEIVSLSIEKEQQDCFNDDEASWIVNMALELPQLGPVHIRISLYEQGVSTRFWSESTKARSLIESRFDQLESNIVQHGMTTLNLCCQAGSPVAPPQSDTNTSYMDFTV